MSYITTYAQSYRKKQQTHVKSGKSTYEEFQTHPEGGNWLTTKIDVKGDLDVTMQKIKEMYAKRYKSVYQKEFGWKTTSTQVNKASDPEISDQLLKTCEITKSKNHDVALLPPLEGARIVFGYMNPKYFHTGHSTYDIEYGIHACERIFGKHLNKPRAFLDQNQKTNAHDKSEVGNDAGDDEDADGIHTVRKGETCKCNVCKRKLV